MVIGKITDMTDKYGTLVLQKCFNFLLKMVFDAKPLDNVNDIETLHVILANKFLECLLNFLQYQSLFDIDIILKMGRKVSISEKLGGDELEFWFYAQTNPFLKWV